MFLPRSKVRSWRWHRLTGKFPRVALESFRPQMPIEPALAESSVLLGIADTKLAAALSEAFEPRAFTLNFSRTSTRRESSLRKIARRWRYFEHDPPRIDGMETCRAIRQQDNDHEHQLPVVMVASQEDSGVRRRGGRHGLADQALYRRLRTNQDTRVGVANSMSMDAGGLF